VVKERGLVAVVGIVVGIAGSVFGGGSLGDVWEAGVMAESWRGRFGSGVGVVGSV
jgi:hypothetical protein